MAGLISEEKLVACANGIITGFVGDIAAGSFDRFLFHSRHHKGREKTEDAQNDEYPAERSREEDHRVSTGKQQRATQTLFADRTEDKCKNYRCGIEIKFAEEITQNAEYHHDNYVNKVLVDSIRTYNAENRYSGDEDSIGKAGYLSKSTAAEKTYSQHEKLDENKACKEGVGHCGMLGEQLRSGLQALNDKTAHQNCGNAFSGDTEGEHGDKRAG